MDEVGGQEYDEDERMLFKIFKRETFYEQQE